MMAGTAIRQLALFVVIATSMAGCENANNLFAKKDNSSTDQISNEAGQSVRQVDRDVEAPEVFQTTDTALWDGRPSLGGVWVASPDTVNPERVILRNEENGKFVIGALFRRERDNPGPKLQISSEAAEALGMLAGQPGKLNVTALRREESKSEVAGVAPDASLLKPEETTAPSADPIAAASAAIARADGTNAAAAVGDIEVPPPTDDLNPLPRQGETKRAARKRVRAAKAAAVALAATPEVDGDAPLAAPVPALDIAPLPDVAPAQKAVPATGADSGTARVQIGIFSVEANAKEAADKLKAGGVSAEVSKVDSKGKIVWVVIASGKGDKKAFLAKVQGLGFVDAYNVSG